MRTILTNKQTEKLLKLGVPSALASKRRCRQTHDGHGNPLEKNRIKQWRNCTPCEKATHGTMRVGLMRFEYQDVFTLEDLLKILPVAIRELGFIQYGFSERGTWVASYDLCDDFTAYGEELIDALFDLIIWLLKNNHPLNY